MRRLTQMEILPCHKCGNSGVLVYANRLHDDTYEGVIECLHCRNQIKIIFQKSSMPESSYDNTYEKSLVFAWNENR